MNETRQMLRGKAFFEERATHLFEKILRRGRWSVNDRDRIADFLEKTAMRARAIGAIGCAGYSDEADE